MMFRSPLADRVSEFRAACQGKCLTAAPSEVLEAPHAIPAGFNHPVEASEFAEGLGLPPDPAEVAFPHIIETEGSDRAGSLTGQHSTVGADRQMRLAPPSHARLRERFIVVRQYPNELHAAIQLGPPSLEHFKRSRDLRA